MDMVKNVVKDAVSSVTNPVIGEDEDIARAKELAGNDARLIAALQVPEEALKLRASHYCMFFLLPCTIPPLVVAVRRLEKTFYIVTDKGIKVHVDPYEPFCGFGDCTNDNKEVDLKDITDVKIVKKGEGCCAGCTQECIKLEGVGVTMYVPDVEKVGEAIKKAKMMADAGEAAADMVGNLTS